MQDYGRRLIVDLPFDLAVHETVEALQAEGLDIVGRVDASEYAQRRAHHDLRRYALLQALPAGLIIEALQHDLDAGVALTVSVAVYELADGETAIVAAEPFGAQSADPAWQSGAAALAGVAERESQQVARALSRLEHIRSKEFVGV